MLSKLKMAAVAIFLALSLIIPFNATAKKSELTKGDLRKLSEPVKGRFKKAFEGMMLEIFNHVRDYPLEDYFVKSGQNKAIDGLFEIFDKYENKLPIVKAGAKVMYKQGSNQVIFYIVIEFRKNFAYPILELPFDVLKMKGIKKEIFDEKLYKIPPNENPIYEI